MPLNRWVAWVAPASTAAEVTSAVASVWPTAAVTPTRAAALIRPARPREFGGDGDDAQMTRGRRAQALEGGHVGGEHVPRILGAAPDRGEKRSLQVNPGDGALVGQGGQHGGPGLEVGERRGDQAGHERGAAVSAVERRRAPGVVS